MNLTKYVACICEGAAEKAIMEILLDADKLIFKRDDLLEGELLRCRSGKNFEEQHLRYLNKFDKEFEGRGVKVIRYADDIVALACRIWQNFDDGRIFAANRCKCTKMAGVHRDMPLADCIK